MESNDSSEEKPIGRLPKLSRPLLNVQSAALPLWEHDPLLLSTQPNSLGTVERTRQNHPDADLTSSIVDVEDKNKGDVSEKNRIRPIGPRPHHVRPDVLPPLPIEKRLPRSAENLSFKPDPVPQRKKQQQATITPSVSNDTNGRNKTEMSSSPVHSRGLSSSIHLFPLSPLHNIGPARRLKPLGSLQPSVSLSNETTSPNVVQQNAMTSEPKTVQLETLTTVPDHIPQHLQPEDDVSKAKGDLDVAEEAQPHTIHKSVTFRDASPPKKKLSERKPSKMIQFSACPEYALIVYLYLWRMCLSGTV